MKPTSQLLVAIRLLNSVENFSAQLTIFLESGRVRLYCRNEKVVFVEFGETFPVSWLTKMMMTDLTARLNVSKTGQEKIQAFRVISDQPDMFHVFRNVVKKHLSEFFAFPIVKCEMKSDPLPESPSFMSISELLTDCAGNFLRSFPMDELIPNHDVSFRLTSDYLEKSTRAKISLQEGYLLSRLDQMHSLKEILPTVPGDEEATKRSLMILWAYGIVDSPFLNQFLPKVEDGKSRQADSSAQVTILNQNDAYVEQVEMVEQTYYGLSKRDFYSLLGVSPKADLAEIKSAYYRLARKFHPDRYYGLDDVIVKEKVDIIFSAINVAYETLKNTKARQLYDNSSSDDKRISATAVGAESRPQSRENVSKVADDYFQHAQKAYAGRNYYEAVQYLRSATQISPDNAKYWRQLGMALSKNDQWRKEAEDSFHRAEELEPQNPENHLYLGYLYKNSGLRLRARKCFVTVLELDPKNELAKAELADIDDEEKQATQKKGGLLGGIFKKK